ncbi:MAG: Rid family detoxifying hydrolase [Cyanobacteria bacterium P01_H01_bin.15]
MKKIIYTSQAPEPVGPYSQGVAQGGMLFVSGQIPFEAATGELVGEDIASQTKQALDNVGAVLAAAGASWESVLKTTVFLTDLKDFAAMNEVYAGYFDPATAPARACVEVARLPKDVRVEIDCIAALVD